MHLFHLLSMVIVLSAAFAYINFRMLKMPSAIGLMLMSLLFSFGVLVVGKYYPSVNVFFTEGIQNFDFSELLLEVMLSFMLFAGAIHIKYEDLSSERSSIILFSTVSVLISTFMVGFSAYYLLNYFGVEVKLMHALLFGALISPTDPIAVLSILKRAGVSKSLETKIAGESLFNDGVAVVVFLTILKLAQPDAHVDFGSVVMLFGQEAIGGLILGAGIGWIGYRLFASINNYQVEVMLTLAIVMGGYTLAHFVHVSGPLAMVVAGIITGNHSKSFGMSEETASYIDKFWELIDEIMNAILFVLIGLELLLVSTQANIIKVAVLLLFIGLISRYISLLVPSWIIRLKEKITQPTLLLLTWGGLRGGISIALALSIQPEMHKDIWVTITYVIVCFSILVQGLTVGKLAKKLN